MQRFLFFEQMGIHPEPHSAIEAISRSVVGFQL